MLGLVGRWVSMGEMSCVAVDGHGGLRLTGRDERICWRVIDGCGGV